LKLDKLISPSIIENNLKSYTLKNNELLDKWKVKDFYLMPFKDQKDESRILYSAITWPGLPLSALYGSLFMNIVILFIACFNFTNTAIAYAQKRLKEIGIRKTFGGVKKQIITQFLLENFIQSLIALLIAMDLAHRWINWMNIQWPIELKDDYLTNPILIIFLFILLVIVTVIAGAYPAFYISRFQPSHILKGDIKLTGTNLFNRVLLTLQFGLSMVAIFSGIVLSLNAKYQTELDFGYNKENVIVVPMHDTGDLEIYRNAVSGLSDINEIAISGHNVGFNYENIEIDIDGKFHHSQRLLIGENYLNTLGLKLLDGRDFQPQSESDMNESIIVNQKFLETYNIQDPLAQSIKIEGEIFYIIGIIQNYMPSGLFRPIMPVILKKIPDNKCHILCVNADPGKITEINNILLAKWKKSFPYKPYEGYYQEKFSDQAENVNTGILIQFGILALFALFLSTAGLYSMVSLSINRRTKEIGIRKVLGASIPHIMNILNREFIIILGIASLFGTVLGFYFMEAFLNDVFEYHLDIGPSVFIISISLIVLAALLTSGRRIYRASQLNPVDSLKYE
jgi:ABC-type antimicrobial peptide transport system permease subunit